MVGLGTAVAGGEGMLPQGGEARKAAKGVGMVTGVGTRVVVARQARLRAARTKKVGKRIIIRLIGMLPWPGVAGGGQPFSLLALRPNLR